jgi:hypothetical protein
LKNKVLSNCLRIWENIHELGFNSNWGDSRVQFFVIICLLIILQKSNKYLLLIVSFILLLFLLIYIYILSFFLPFVQRCFFIKKIILCTCEAITLRVAPEHEFGSFHLFYPFFLSITIVLRILGYILNNWTHQILQHCIYISKTLIIALQQNSHLQTEFKRRGSQLPGHLMF